MSTIAVMMCKDEADIIRYTCLHLLEEVDRLLVADNMSTDGTRDILNDLAQEHKTLQVIDDDDPAYYQSKKMTALATLAAEECGEESPWIVPVDADELWFANGDRIAVELSKLTVDAVRAPLYNHFCSSIDEESDNPFQRIVYRQRDPGALPKVAFRWNPNVVIAQGNHGVNIHTPIIDAGLELRHFPYRSPEQFIHKALNGAAAYKATDLPVSEGAHWREYGLLYERRGEAALREVYETWFFFRAPVTAGMICDPAPYNRWHP